MDRSGLGRGTNQRHRQLIARQSRDGNLAIDQRQDRRRQPTKQFVADIEPMAIVDELEAVELDRDHRQRQPFGIGTFGQPRALVGEALAVEQSGHGIGRRHRQRPGIALGALLAFMMQVDVAPPAEQDQRDIEA